MFEFEFSSRESLSTTAGASVVELVLFSSLDAFLVFFRLGFLGDALNGLLFFTAHSISMILHTVTEEGVNE